MTQTGSIGRLSVKPQVKGEYGLPKHAVPQLRITSEGAEGDYNHFRTTKLNGDPNQAVLVLTEEVLVALRSEGWPVQAGDLGENLTLAGVPEASLKPGSRLRIGQCELEVSLACDPCTETYSLPYVGTEKGPAFVRTLMGRRGWYARVVAPGTIATGDKVSVTTP
jgi:MOSC domain-containing protein YiiM